MAYLLFSIVMMWSAVEGGYLIDIHPVHGPSVHKIGAKSSVSSVRALTSGSHSAFSHHFPGNIIEQTRAQAESTKKTLKSISKNEKAAQYIENVIRNNICISDLEDAIEAIEAVAKLVENNGPEILDLTATVESLENEKDITQLVRSSANILRKLSNLVPNFAEQPYKVCDASSEDTIKSFNDLAKQLEVVSYNAEIQMSSGVRVSLKSSSKMISEISSFLGNLNKSLADFTGLCVKDNDYNTALLNTIGDIMEDMAALFNSLGGEEKSKGIQKNRTFVKQIVVSVLQISITLFKNFLYKTLFYCRIPSRIWIFSSNWIVAPYQHWHRLWMNLHK